MLVGIAQERCPAEAHAAAGPVSIRVLVGIAQEPRERRVYTLDTGVSIRVLVGIAQELVRRELDLMKEIAFQSVC